MSMKLSSFIRNSFGALAVAGAVLLAGCGGGASPLGVSYTLPPVPTDPVIITDTNAQAVAKDALAGSAGSASAGVGGVSGIVIESESTTTVKLHLDDAINMANKLLIDQLNVPQTPAGITQTLFCNGADDTEGTITVTTEGNDARVTYNNCGDPALFVINGVMAGTNVSYSGTPPTPPFSLSVTYSYSLTFTYNNGAEIIAMMGRFDIAMSVDEYNEMISSTSNGEMGMTSGGESVVMTGINNSQSCDNWDSYGGMCLGIMTVSNNYSVGGTLSDGTFTVATTTPLEIAYGATYPYTGVIEITGANNSYLKITINDDELDKTGAPWDIQVFMDPDTTDTLIVGGETTNDYNWDTI